MLPQVVVLNGGSSSGKTTIARHLQGMLPGIWLAFGIDSLVDALPAATTAIEIGPAGQVDVDERFGVAEAAWRRGLAAMTRHGVSVVVDDVFLGGAASQQRWRDALGDATAVWVGVHCDPDVAAAREAARRDRVAGMAERQATTVHDGVHYDLEVDSSDVDAATCAETIARHLTAD